MITAEIEYANASAHRLIGLGDGTLTGETLWRLVRCVPRSETSMKTRRCLWWRENLRDLPGAARGVRLYGAISQRWARGVASICRDPQ